MAIPGARLLLVASLSALVAIPGLPASSAAQEQGCLADAEPNDTPETAPQASGPVCIEGSLETGDQDLFLWEVPAGSGERAWSIQLRGVQGTLTSLRLLEVTSQPGLPPVVGNELLKLDSPPEATEAVSAPAVLLPERRYVLGVSRTERPDGARPWTTDYAIGLAADDPPEVASEPPTGAFSIAGRSSTLEPAVVAWSLPETEADMAWRIEASGPLGTGLSLRLMDGHGEVLASAYNDPLGRILLADLALPPGAYSIEVSVSAEPPAPFRLSALTTLASGDPEPNDLATRALPVDIGGEVRRGRLFPAGDRDAYRLQVAPDAEDELFDVRLLFDEGPHRDLCLSSLDESQLQCRGGRTSFSLPALRLPAGAYLLTIGGDPDAPATELTAASGYVLRVDVATAARPDFEAEPNDVPALASPLDPAIAMRGRGTAGDVDVFGFEVGGEPQLWDVRVSGDAVANLAWVRADGTILGDAAPGPGEAEARLTDLFLVPGRHHVQVAGEGEYELRLTPLGPPDPDAEREPNDDVTLAEPVRLSRSRVIGRLATDQDVDIFRFSLAGTERLGLNVVPPAESVVESSLERERVSIAAVTSPGPGRPTRYEALLGPGDYEIRLRLPPGSTASDERYELTLDRGDPFARRDDEEPNDRREQASDFGPTLRIRGDTDARSDIDWYALPPLERGSPLRLSFEGEIQAAALSDGVTDLPTVLDAEAGSLSLDGSEGFEARYLRIQASGPYQATLSAPGLVPAAEPSPLPVAMGVSVDRGAVAAYWPTGQQVTGAVELANEGSVPLELELDTLASHHGWRVELEERSVSVAPGETLSVPLTIVVPADAWADEPVLVHVRARADDGGEVSAGTALTPGRETLPVAPLQLWPLPDALSGGLDVASLALGAVPVPMLDPAGEAALHDGLTVAGAGLQAPVESLPLTLTVDLAGNAPLPVAGMILDPLAGNVFAGNVPKDVELLVSADGVTYTAVLAEQMSTLLAEQAFLLEEPVLATHAQLRITSVHGGAALGGVALGEWKVVAVPGAAPDGSVIDLASPAAGGHVAWMDPQPADWHLGERVLDDDPTVEYVWVEPGDPLTFAVAFRAGRAARIERLEWRDPSGSLEHLRSAEVDVELSLEGPAGPWVPVGRWTLERRPDGSVAPFDPPGAPWARAVLLRLGAPVGDTGQRELPGGISVIEQAMDEAYRSALGEWGAANPLGPFELLDPPELEPPEDEPDDDDGPESARPLTAGTPASGRVSTGSDVDWYALRVPEGDNTLAIEVAGRPTVAVALTLVDADGLRVPMLFGPGDRPGTVLYRAEVSGGAEYRLEVRQPPSSIVFTFDTSGSVAPYLEDVYHGLRAFSADVIEGREAVLVIPFEEPPLLEGWSDQRYELQNAVDRFVIGGGSSSAETALIEAATQLGAREGARAILVVTDAETTSFDRSTELWRTLASVRPIIFSVHIGGSGEPYLTTSFMQDWAGVAGGVYRYAATHGEMDRAFDRLATWLRRPATYELSLATRFEEEPPPSRDPGSIAVRSPIDGSGRGIAQDVGIEIVLDTSGSMLERLRGRRRIDAAREALRELLGERIPAGTPVALRVFGDAGDRCGTRLALPLGPLDPASMVALIEGLPVERRTLTPIAAALEQIPDDLAGASGTKIVVLITDGDETCDGDVPAAIRSLEGRGIDARVNIVGFALDDRKLRRRMRGWARQGDGSYFDARGAGDLGAAIERAIGAPFRVLDEAGNEVASGTLDGDPVAVAPGTYSVVVLTDPVARFDGLIIAPGEDVVREVAPAPEETPADEADAAGAEAGTDPDSDRADDPATTVSPG